MRCRHTNAGFTVVELAVGTVVMTILATTLVALTRTSQQHGTTIQHQTRASEQLRISAERISTDLRQTEASRLTIVTLTDGNHQVTLQCPVSVSAGTVAWGVTDKVAGPGGQVGWYVRYTVEEVVDQETTRRQLVRQILDDSMSVWQRKVLVRYLRDGLGAEPGFRVTPNGSIWRVEVGTLGSGNQAARSTAFDIALMN